MDNNALLQIILQARDEATQTIKNMGDSIDDVSKRTANMSSTFKAAGGVLLGVGVAGVGIMKSWVDAASAHQVAMAGVDATLKNVAADMQYTSVTVAGNAAEVKNNKSAIDEHIRSIKEQILQYETMGGKHKAEIAKLQDEQKALELQKLQEQDVTVTKNHSIQVINDQAVSFDQLRKITEQVSDSYVKLGFNDNETATAFANDLRVTQNVTDAKTMLAAATDLARLKGEDLATATQQVTLAYEGNTRVLKSLGIETEKGAKGMQVINDIEHAASGQADAFSKTFAGASAILGAQFDQLKEKLGDRLLPTITQFVTSIGSVVDKLNNLSPKTYDTIVNVVKFGTAFGLIGGPILLFIGFLPSLIAGFGAISAVALPLVVILAGLAVGAYLLYTHWNQIAPVVSQLKDAISNFVKDAVKQITDFYIKNKATFDAFFTDVKLIFQFALAFLSALWKTVWGTIKDILVDIWNVIKSVIQTAWGIIQLIIGVGLGILTGNWQKAWGIISDSFKNIWEGIKNIAKGAMNSIVDSVVLMINTVIGLINGMLSGINALTKNIPGGSKFQIGTIQPLAIPHFDTGGYVPKTGIAVVHEGEFVLSKDMLAGKQNAPQNIVTNNRSQPITIYATINQDIDLALMANNLAFALRNSR